MMRIEWPAGSVVSRNIFALWNEVVKQREAPELAQQQLDEILSDVDQNIPTLGVRALKRSISKMRTIRWRSQFRILGTLWKRASNATVQELQ